MRAAFLPAFLQSALSVLFGLLLAGPPARAQANAAPEPIRFGQPDPADFTAAPFLADSTAPAVVLCDYGTTSILAGDGNTRQLRFDRTTRIKILTKAGLEWANVVVPLYSKASGYTEHLTTLRGFTYDLVNGRVQPEALAAGSVFTDAVSDQYAQQKFALPNVRVGSVIEYSYTIFSDDLISFRGWEFQERIPVRWSEYRAAMPYRYLYKIFLQSTQPLAIDEKTDQQTLTPRYRWAMRNVPALRPEPFTTTPVDYVDKLRFELASYAGH